MVIHDPHRPLAFEDDLTGHRMGDHRQVRTAHGRAQVGVGGGAAHAILHRHVHGAEAFLHEAVGVVGLDIAGLGTGIDPGTVQRVLHVVAVGGAQRPAIAAIGIAALLVALGPFEVRQAVAIAPIAGAELLPFVEVVGMATDVDQAVDRRRAAEHLAPRAMHAAPVETRFRLGFVAPVVLLGVHRDREGAGHLDQHAAVAAAELQHQHRGGGIRAEAIGQDAAGRTGTDDDVVITLSHCCNSANPGRAYGSCRRGCSGRHPSPGVGPAPGSVRSGRCRRAGKTAARQ
ncbi:hypothetical protein D3C85_543400 [compost metagenome]